MMQMFPIDESSVRYIIIYLFSLSHLFLQINCIISHPSCHTDWFTPATLQFTVVSPVHPPGLSADLEHVPDFEKPIPSLYTS